MSQEKSIENFNNFILSDSEMINVRGGDEDDTTRGTVTPPMTEPEI